MSDDGAVNFFRDKSVNHNPYPYFDQLRDQCPVLREPHQNVVMVTGYDEAIEVYRDTERFSSATSVTGPFPGFPIPLEGREDVVELIDKHRDDLPFSDQLPTFDPPKHTAHRGLLMRLLTPRRLAESEEAMGAIADRQLDEFVSDGHRGEFVSGFAGPFAMLVIANLLGVPDEDLSEFRTNLGLTKGLGDSDKTMSHTPLEFLYEKFSAYVEDRRAAPRDDVLTRMAQATFKDGSTPEVLDVVRLAANLFAAGQETSVRMMAAALMFMGEDQSLQQRLRENRDLIPNFIEEVLRIESPVKGDFRLSKCPVNVGGVELPAGTTVMVLNAAANHDARHFDTPHELVPDRDNAREHLTFGHGIHFCPGAPLARAEGRITIERMLDRMSGIRIDESEHGPADGRRYRYVPTFILRGLTRLYLEFDS
jgi:cytochrome P450 family 150 subfamily A5